MAKITTTSAAERCLLFSVIKTPEMGVKSTIHDEREYRGDNLILNTLLNVSIFKTMHTTFFKNIFFAFTLLETESENKS